MSGRYYMFFRNMVHLGFNNNGGVVKGSDKDACLSSKV